MIQVRGRYKKSKVFLALFIYGLLCQVLKTASVQLFSGVACGP
jgi:hypothetical protein